MLLAPVGEDINLLTREELVGTLRRGFGRCFGDAPDPQLLRTTADTLRGLMA